MYVCVCVYVCVWMCVDVCVCVCWRRTNNILKVLFCFQERVLLFKIFVHATLPHVSTINIKVRQTLNFEIN